MIHFSYGLLGAVMSSLLLTLAILVWFADAPLWARIYCASVLILVVILMWLEIDNQWDWWSARNEICYPDGKFVNSFECEHFGEPPAPATKEPE